MSDKFTPGPWVPEPGGGRGSWIAGSNSEWAALSCGNTDEAAEANARLIAAAPEMLAALRLSLNAWATTGVSNGAIREAQAAARAAIAKATGDAP